MKEQKKKRLIAILLLLSCLVSGYMLFIAPQVGSQQLTNLAYADSLINRDLTNFNISEQQIRITTNRVDSNLSRKTYHISVPYGFSKTQLHAELNRSFHNYAVETPARVTLPEKDVNIHLTLHGTVVRTIKIETDPDLVLNRNRASILLAFEEMPDNEMINDLTSLGEPFPVVLKVENPLQANEFKKQLTDRYNHLLFWLQNGNDEDLIRANPADAMAKLKQLENVFPGAMMLTFADASSSSSNERVSGQTNLAFVNATDALMLHKELGKASFFEELNKLKSNKIHPMAIITGNATTLSWLREKLPELKKAGVNFVPPPTSHL